MVIFDWDGTLLDSTGKIVLCMQRAAEDVGLVPPDREAVRNIIGLGLHESVAMLFPDLPAAQLPRLRDRYAAHFVAEDQQPCAPFPGAVELLAALRHSGRRVAVATGKSRRGLDRVWASTGLGEYFHDSRCADETRSKPHPQMLQELCDAARLSPAECLMVGDTEWDLAMAASIDMPRVGVAFGAHDPARLERHEPDLIINKCSELREYLDI